MEHTNSDTRQSSISSKMLTHVQDLHGIRRRIRRLEHALEIECRTVRRVMHATNDLVLLVDEQGLVLALNGQGASALGTTATDALGRLVSELLPPPLRERVISAMQLAMESGQPVTVLDQVCMPRKVHLRCDPVVDSHGKTQRVVIAVKHGS